MNVFFRYTWATLRKNKARTAVTVIGIVLSVALFTAVIEGAHSGVQFLLRSAEYDTGVFHGFYEEFFADDRAALEQEPSVVRTTAWHRLGWAEIGSGNRDKPYLLVQSMEPDFTELVAVHLVAGRLPQTAEEILLPEHLISNGSVSLALGEQLTVELGRRESLEGTALGYYDPYTPDQEQLVERKSRTYTVVGICQRLDYLLEPYGCPGYMALTCGEESGPQRVFFTVDRPREYYTLVRSLPLEGNVPNSTLLSYSGVTGYANLNDVIYGFMTVLLFLIFFGSVSLIYNSFSISVSERTRQFGILKSVGATKKQIRGSVLYEAAVLCAMAIPLGLVVGCAGIGITLYCLRDSFGFVAQSVYTGDGAAAVQMRLVLSVPGLAAAAVIGLVTALVSAWVPAKRAVALSAIDAIRQTGDVAVRGRDVRTGRLTQKLFGFPGMLAAKNFKRNRRRYRSTVLSLFLSVTLFISSSSFCAYLTDAVGDVAARESEIDLSYYTAGVTAEENERVRQLIASADGVEEVVAYRHYYQPVRLQAAALDGEVRQMAVLTPVEGDEAHWDVNNSFFFLSHEEYLALVRRSGLDEAAYTDPAYPVALVWDRVVQTYYREDEQGNSTAYTVSGQLLKEDALPLKASYVRWQDREGYVCQQTVRLVDGKRYAEYWPMAYMERFWQSGEKTPDPAMAELVPYEEAVWERELLLGARGKELPFYATGSNSGRMVLFYPESAMEQVLGGPVYETSFAIRASDHRSAYNAISRLLAQEGEDVSRLNDHAEDSESIWAMVRVVNVFSYGFIILISLIAMANVFNTISTNIALRRREFAMLQSMGLSRRGFKRMMNYECLIYGVRGLLWGLPASVIMTYVIYRIVGQAFSPEFYIPWYSVAIAVGSVFAVVFATMLYATSRLRRENLIDALKTENL